MLITHFLFLLGIGEDIAEKYSSAEFAPTFFDRFSQDFQHTLGAEGFSSSHIIDVKKFYELDSKNSESFEQVVPELRAIP